MNTTSAVPSRAEEDDDDDDRSFGDKGTHIPFYEATTQKYRVAPAPDPEPKRDVMEVTDFDAPGLDSASTMKFKPAPRGGEAWERGRMTSVPSQSALELMPASKVGLDSLQDMFADPESYRFKSVGLSLAESTAALTCLMKAGCTSTEELVAYLDHHKQPRACSCGKSEHTLQCATRQAGAWTAALVSTGIPVFHARKIILSVKSYLA
jgi:hypothetical protein